MDYCKNKQFIAFINKNSRDRYWCDGYFAWDEYAPTLHPYDTKEQRKIAIEIGEAIAAFSETNEIEAVILTVGTEIIPIVNKENKSDALARFEKRSVDNIQKQEALKKKALEEKKKNRNENPDEGLENNNEVDSDLSAPPRKILDLDSDKQRADSNTKQSTKKTEAKVNENKNEVVLQKQPRNTKVSTVPNSDKEGSKKLGIVSQQKNEIAPVEKKRSPLEKKIPKQQEMVKMEQTAPSEPKKKSGLSKIMKGK